MKIWYQTASKYRYDPNLNEYGRTLEEQCRRTVRSGTEVYVTGVPERIQGWDKFKFSSYFNTSQIINNMLKAQNEGYDAVVIGNSLDVGLEEGREMLSIPIVGIAHANFHMAAMLGELFAIVTTESHIAERYRQMVIRYGLTSKYIQRNYVFNVSESEIVKGAKEPQFIVEKFKAEAERAVADGASVIIPVPAPVYQLFYKTQGLANIGGALVLDPVAVAVKTAEMLVDLKKIGIEVSRKPGVYASPNKEFLKSVLATYSKTFKIDC